MHSRQANTSMKGLYSEALFISPCHLLDKDAAPAYNTQTRSDADTTLKDEKLLLCVHCGHVITSRQHASDINGQHVYCFRNPAGTEFVIGCFDKADGCTVIGPAESRWSWFPPHHWSMALCRQCGNHLGWHYGTGSAAGFYGLVLKLLQEK